MNVTLNNFNSKLAIKALGLAVIAMLLLILLPFCKKNNEEKAHLSVRMTDAPAAYNAVYIDLKSVEIIGSGGNITALNTHSGIYNLLDYSNGLDTLIATGSFDADEASQIRLILGPNNTVVIDNISYPLSTPSAMQSGLKLLVKKSFNPGESYTLLLDFDANQSIVEEGNGSYLLKPVLRIIDSVISGSLKGNIIPVGITAAVIATHNGSSYTSVTNTNGEFLISGIPAATYDITIVPGLPLLPVTVTGKAVTVGNTFDIGTIVL
jgi:hypothetical protein